jgi:hypothetical protein
MQFSLFGAEVAQPQLHDLDGLILAGGDFTRADQDRIARLSVVVDSPWRVLALQAEFARRGLTSDVAPAPSGGTTVRSEFSTDVGGLAGRWVRSAVSRLPADLELSASGLRLWCIANGQVEPVGYLLGVGDPGGPIHRAAGAQLARLGVAAVEVSGRASAGWRVTSTKRIRRLAELVGESPDGGQAQWPAG